MAAGEGQCGWMSELCISVVEEESEDDATIASWSNVECFSGLERGNSSDAVMTDVLMYLRSRVIGWSWQSRNGLEYEKKKKKSF